jgi:hypothetical protein
LLSFCAQHQGDEWKDGGDLGLQLKFEKRNLGMPGFTQRHPNGKGWQVCLKTKRNETQRNETAAPFLMD